MDTDCNTSQFQVSEKKKKNKDLKYDILGWVILAVGIIVWVGVAKSHVPPPPARYETYCSFCYCCII